MEVLLNINQSILLKMLFVFLVTTITLFTFTILFSYRFTRFSKAYKIHQNSGEDLRDEHLPLIEIPQDCELEDILVDRWYDDVPASRDSK